MVKKKEVSAAERLQHFKAAANQVEEKLEAVLTIATPDKLSKMEPVMQAQVHGGLSQALITLFEMYLRTQGVDPDQHAVAKEKKRVNMYLNKIDQAANKLDLQNSKRTLDINLGAANRFISAAIPELTSEQRLKLKEVGRQHAAELPSKKRRKSSGKGIEAKASASAAAQATAFLDDLVVQPANDL